VLKEINTECMPEEQQINAIEEVNILGSVSSPHIVKYYDSFICDESNINILMEYCPKGDLGSFLENRRIANQSKLSEKYIWKFFIQICVGLYDLHKSSIIHRDLKSVNVFLTKEYNMKIGDMGAAKVIKSSSESKQVSKVGTPYYLSPEVCRSEGYSYKSDIWALGCILYELCTLHKPFLANTQEDLIYNILQGKLYKG
jgi:NIMA (never in mitosis gene a)-related kinase